MSELRLARRGAALMSAFFLVAGTGIQAEPNTKVDDFALLDHKGGFHHLYYFEKDESARAIVLFVQGNGCPLVRKQIPLLKALRASYGARGVRFWLINANLQDSRTDVADEARQFGIDFPILLDETQLVAEALGLHRTAEALVIQPRSWQIVYRGPISDRLNYEAERPEATREFLREALDAVLADQPVSDPAVASPGCIVNLPNADPAEHAGISYSQTIAPLLIRRCAGCHTTGGIAPWAMSNHRKVQGWGPMMKEVMLTQRMPPWQADPHVGDFANDFSLSAEETAALVHWIDAGCRRGDGPDPLAAFRPERPEWRLGPPDCIVDVGEESVPAEGVIDYRYRQVESPFDHDVWIRAVEVNPGNTRALHHVLAWTFDPREEVRRQKARRKGLAGYAPGMGPAEFPKGTGIHLRAGHTIEFQLHYTATGRPETDRTRLGLYVASHPPEKELHGGVVIESKFEIPPGDPSYTTAKSQVFERDVWLYSMNPHMHYRGRSMTYEARYPDGRRETLLSVPHYHFNWQRSYRLREPKFLPKGTALVVTATWDNSTLNPFNPDPERAVTWGEQTWDEMFFASYQYVDAADVSPPEQ